MEIVLALLRTLVFVVATVAATVYVGRRIGRGRPLLWTGTTLLALYWLILFGWSSYLTGTTNPSADLAIWVGWGGHLLPFFAALAYIWGIGQAAGFPSRAGAGAGAALGKAGKDGKDGKDATPAEPVSAGGAASTPGSANVGGTEKPTTQPAGGSGTATPATKGAAPAPFPGPHAVPVVTTPSSESQFGQGERAEGRMEQPGSTDDTDRPAGQG